MKQTFSVVCAALALVVTLASCGSSSKDAEPAASARPTVSVAKEADPSDSVTGIQNDADTEFAQMMLLHVEGAIEMADLAAQRAITEEVRALAAQISAAQDPEIEKVITVLAARREDHTSKAEKGTGTDHGGMDGGMLMEGLNRKEALSDLAARTGADFDERFLELMTAHHRETVVMAQVELDRGQSLYALDLAQQIIADQETQIEHMTQLLSAGVHGESPSWL